MNVPAYSAYSEGVAAASTKYLQLFGSNLINGHASADRVYANIQNPGTYSNLATYISANAITVGTATLSTWTTVTGNCTIAMTSASGTGWFEDTVNTDSMVDGSNWCARFVGATTGTITPSGFQGLWAPTTGQFQLLTARLEDFGAGVTTSQYFAFGTTDNWFSTVASNYGNNIPFAGTLRNLHTNCDAYSRTGGTFDRLRTYIVETPAAGNCTVTISSAAAYEDTTNTDTVTAGQRWCWEFNTDRTGGQCRMRGDGARIELHATASNFLFCGNRYGSGNNDVDCSFPVSGSTGRWGTENDTRAKMQHRADVAFTWSNLWGNHLGAAATIRSDINGAGAAGTGNGNQTITMAAGEVTDAVNTDTVAIGDLLSWSNDFTSGGAYTHALSSMGTAISAGGGGGILYGSGMLVMGPLTSGRLAA